MTDIRSLDLTAGGFEMRIAAIFALTMFQCSASAQAPEPQPQAVAITIPGDDKEAMGERDLFAWLVRKPREADGSQGFHGFRSEWKGKPVQVEGFYWHGKVVFDGGDIGCKSESEKPIAKNGKLVRVMGILEHDHRSWSRFGSTPPYFYIDVKVAKVIDAVDDPHLVGLTPN